MYILITKSELCPNNSYAYILFTCLNAELYPGLVREIFYYFKLEKNVRLKKYKIIVYSYILYFYLFILKHII